MEHRDEDVERFRLRVKINGTVQPIYRFTARKDPAANEGDAPLPEQQYILSTEGARYSIEVANWSDDYAAFSLAIDGQQIGRVYILRPGEHKDIGGFFDGYRTTAGGSAKVEVLRSFVFGATADTDLIHYGGNAVRKAALGTITLKVNSVKMSHVGKIPTFVLEQSQIFFLSNRYAE